MTTKNVFHDDGFHNVVKKALQKEGWNMTQDPLLLDVAGQAFSLDFAAEKFSEVS